MCEGKERKEKLLACFLFCTCDTTFFGGGLVGCMDG